jgi:hypothetical protein
MSGNSRKTYAPQKQHFLARTIDLQKSQLIEMFDVKALQFYEDMAETKNNFNIFAAEVLIALLRLSKWAVNGTMLDWPSLYDEYQADSSWPENKLHYSSTDMAGDTHGLDLIAKALCEIINWKVWNYPNLATDYTSSHDVFHFLRDGATSLIRPDTPFPLTDFDPDIPLILDAMKYRIYVETDFIFEEARSDVSARSEEELHELEKAIFTPDRGYVDVLTEVTVWYLNLSDPLYVIGQAMHPVTLPSNLESLSKQDFVNRISDNLDRKTSLPDLPRFDIVLGPMSYGSHILLGEFLIKVQDDAVPEFSFRLQRNQSIPFEIIHTQIGTKYEQEMLPTDLYALCIYYILSVNTPGGETSYDQAEGSFWHTPWLGKKLVNKDDL